MPEPQNKLSVSCFQNFHQRCNSTTKNNFKITRHQSHKRSGRAFRHHGNRAAAGRTNRSDRKPFLRFDNKTMLIEAARLAQFRAAQFRTFSNQLPAFGFRYLFPASFRHGLFAETRRKIPVGNLDNRSNLRRPRRSKFNLHP